MEYFFKMISKSDLDSQILFMENMGKVITAPIIISIIHSLKELKGIKKSRIPKLMDNPDDRVYGC